MTGHAPEFGGHDAETGGHAPPKYAHPARHDFGPKLILGRTIRGSGAAELDEALDLLVAHPSTARFISRKLAIFFLADDPPAPMVDAMARAFRASGGDIKATLRPLLLSDAFMARAPLKFKDPMHYVLSAVRAGFEGHDVRNTQPVTAWLRELGQDLYDRSTPDGYPDRADAWNSAGQMSTRFEVARQMAGAAAVLGQEPGGPAPAVGAPPLRAQQALLRERVEPTLGVRTRAALQEAETPQRWLALLFSSPEFMLR